MFKTLIFVAIFVYSECSIISHNNKKCDVKDYDCQLDYINNILKEAVDNGIPEFNIPILDPYNFENMELDLGFMKVDLANGVAQGLKTCRIYNYRLEIEKKTAYLELNCEMYSIESQYECKKMPLLANFIGDLDVHGKGTGGITIENKRSSIELVYETKKFDDGELHVVIIPDKIKYTFLSADKMSMAFDNFYIGTQEISGIMVKIFNENWKSFSKYFNANPGIEKIGEILAVNLNNFFKEVPIKNLVKN